MNSGGLGIGQGIATHEMAQWGNWITAIYYLFIDIEFRVHHMAEGIIYLAKHATLIVVGLFMSPQRAERSRFRVVPPSTERKKRG